jgi:hypothetical protein
MLVILLSLFMNLKLKSLKRLKRLPIKNLEVYLHPLSEKKAIYL